MNKKVLGIGEVVLDKVHKLSAFPLEGEKINAQSVDITLGGPVPAALILLSRLGVECALAGSVAHDEGGEIITSLLEKEGVLLLAQKAHTTPVHTVLVNAQTGSRTIIKETQTSGELEAVSKEVVQSAHIIISDRHEPRAVLSALATKRNATVSLMDPSVDCSPSTIQLLKKMDFPIIPIETLHLLFPKDTLVAGAKKLALLLSKPTVITMGEYGSAVCENGEVTIHPSVAIKVVDTLGAGDIFRGGFAYGLLKGWNIHQCAQFANCVAALQCTKLGNSSAIPTREEVFSMQKSITHLSNSISLI